jgi:hypothetical protein
VILSDEYLQSLLDQVLSCVDASPTAGIALEGSIAEGFGNESSDIDFVIVDDSERKFVAMPTLLFLDGRRIEVRTRSVQDVRDDAERIVAAGENTGRRLSRTSYDEIDRWQRLAGAYPLRNHSLIESVQGLVPADDVRVLVNRWFSTIACESARCAIALSVLGQSREAINWVQTALDQSAKAWLALRGETYLGLKWISRQFARVADGLEVQARYISLVHGVDKERDPDEYVAECLSAIGAFGIAGCERDARSVVLGLARDVTTWQIGHCVYVVRARRDVFAFDSEVEAVWRSLAFDVPIPVVLGRCQNSELAGELIAEFHRLGLLRFCWRGGGEIQVRGAFSAPPQMAARIVSLSGEPQSDSEGGGISLVPLTASRFAAAGMALAWANVEIENAREDALGAVASEQWGVLRAAARRMVRKASVAVLSAHGVVLLPGKGSEEDGGLGGTSWQRRETVEEACSQLATIGNVPQDIVEVLGDIEADSQVYNKEEALRLLEVLDGVVARVRQFVGASTFPSSFNSAAGWRETVEMGYDWIRLGAYMDSTFPVDEAREVLAAGAVG